MAASANQNIEATRPQGEILHLPLVDAQAVYRHTLQAIERATGSDQGRIAPYDATVDQIVAGWAATGETGDTDGGNLYTEKRVDVHAAIPVVLLPVTGVAGTYKDVGLVVYASDDFTFSTTRGVRGYPVGVVVEHYSSSKAYVRAFTTSDLVQFSAQPMTVLNSGQAALPSADGNVKYIRAPYKAKITRVAYNFNELPQTAASTMVASLKISDVAVSGGSLTFQRSTSGVAVGARVEGTTVAGSNVVYEGQLIAVHVNVGTTAPNAGAIEAEITLEALMGY